MVVQFHLRPLLSHDSAKHQGPGLWKHMSCTFAAETRQCCCCEHGALGQSQISIFIWRERVKRRKMKDPLTQNDKILILKLIFFYFLGFLAYCFNPRKQETSDKLFITSQVTFRTEARLIQHRVLFKFGPLLLSHHNGSEWDFLTYNTQDDLKHPTG